MPTIFNPPRFTADEKYIVSTTQNTEKGWYSCTIVSSRPRSLSQLANPNGSPPVQVTKYGDTLAEAMRNAFKDYQWLRWVNGDSSIINKQFTAREIVEGD